jgi:Kelch motif
MKLKRRKFLILSFFFVLSTCKVFSQNQWAFLRGYLSSNIDNNNYFTAVDSLNPLNKPSSREHCGSGIYNNKIWIFGGEGNNSGSDVWQYDIKFKAWAFASNKGPNEVFADKNIESSIAHPGNKSRMASSMDKTGNLWLFGGSTNDLGTHTGWNDLWKYNTNNKKWTWLGGSNTHSSAGSYNVPTVPDWPRARYRTRGWFDEDGNYWIFGGLYYNGVNLPYPLNDMWKFNVSTSVWTCETGDCNTLHLPNTPSGVYPSSVGQTSINYKPRARGDYGYWIDNNGDFWLYGGFNGEVHSGGIMMWDTWKYNTRTHEWTLLTLEDAPSSTSPGWQAEQLCWIGNDGLPWMKLVNRSIWKFKNGHWENQRFEAANTFAPPILLNNQAFVANAVNQPGSHYTTFNHIKTDSAVYLFNGYGLGFNNVPNYTGALWQYNLEVFPLPKLALNISNDDFVPNGASPYTFSNREITIKNIGQDTARNVVINFGLSPLNNQSAMRLNSLSVVDSVTNNAIWMSNVITKPYIFTDAINSPACAYDTSLYKSNIEITIPFIKVGQTIKVSALVDHCMANFNSPTNYQYTWNNWGTKAYYKNKAGKKYSIEPKYNNVSNTLNSYSWTQYTAPLPNLKDTTGSQLFTIELGSGLMGVPSNSQNLGTNFGNAQARLDLTLPHNVYLANGRLSDITGEYATVAGSVVQLFNVDASVIQYQFTQAAGTQSYVIRFPASQYLPIRRIFVKLRAKSYPVNMSIIKANIRTTFNSLYANLDYGWKPSSP